MTDKAGLICPGCGEALATVGKTAVWNACIKCLSCSNEFSFAQTLDEYVEDEIFPLSVSAGVWCVDASGEWCRISPHCDNGCAWIEPYGWVPEAGCSVHDPED